MDHFKYRSGQLFCEDVNINELAKQTGTPFYLYSQATFIEHFNRFSSAFQELNPLICYSIKNCANINIINLLVQNGAGMDVVSGGELFRALEGGADAAKIVYAGVGKTTKEIRSALEAKIGWLNIESANEFENIRKIAAEMKCKTKAALRVNPNVYDKKTHSKCATGKSATKFGVDISQAKQFFKTYGNDPWLKLAGIHIHLGSPIFTSEPYVKAINKVLALIAELKAEGYDIELIDLGGGYVCHYDGKEEIQTWDDYAFAIVPLLKAFVEKGGQIILEPGRSISANAGVLITQVQYTKQGGHKKFVIVDTGMSHLIRPTLYEAYHFIWPTKVSLQWIPEHRQVEPNLNDLETVDIVGPICEASDYLARDRKIPPVQRGDLLCVFTAGAYCMTMASQYNSVPRPPEVLVHGNKAKLIRGRESYNDLIALERETEVIAIP